MSILRIWNTTTFSLSADDHVTIFKLYSLKDVSLNKVNNWQESVQHKSAWPVIKTVRKKKIRMVNHNWKSQQIYFKKCIGSNGCDPTHHDVGSGKVRRNHSLKIGGCRGSNFCLKISILTLVTVEHSHQNGNAYFNFQHFFFKKQWKQHQELEDLWTSMQSTPTSWCL